MNKERGHIGTCKYPGCGNKVTHLVEIKCNGNYSYYNPKDSCKEHITEWVPSDNGCCYIKSHRPIEQKQNISGATFTNVEDEVYCYSNEWTITT